MNSVTPRRDFLRATALTMLGAGTAGAIEPLKRNGTAKFKFSLAAYSYRKLLSSGKLTMADFVSDCAKMGLEGTELTSYYFPADVSDADLRSLKQHCFRLGLDVSGTAVGNDFCHPKGNARDKQIAHVKKWIDRAEVLGAPVIRIFSGRPHGKQTTDEAIRLAITGIEECCDYAGKHGVYLALENHGGLTSTPDGMLKIVRGVKSAWFGVNLDTGNFHGDDVYAELAQIAPYAVNVQVKVVTHGADKVRKPSDFGRLAKILRGVGYRGYVVLEYEEKGDPRVECPKFVEQLRKGFA